jgi:hypothetical protein
MVIKFGPVVIKDVGNSESVKRGNGFELFVCEGYHAGKHVNT